MEHADARGMFAVSLFPKQVYLYGVFRMESEWGSQNRSKLGVNIFPKEVGHFHKNPSVVPKRSTWISSEVTKPLYQPLLSDLSMKTIFCRFTKCLCTYVEVILYEDQFSSIFQNRLLFPPGRSFSTLIFWMVHVILEETQKTSVNIRSMRPTVLIQNVPNLEISISRLHHSMFWSLLNHIVPMDVTNKSQARLVEAFHDLFPAHLVQKTFCL